MVRTRSWLHPVALLRIVGDDLNGGDATVCPVEVGGCDECGHSRYDGGIDEVLANGDHERHDEQMPEADCVGENSKCEHDHYERPPRLGDQDEPPSVGSVDDDATERSERSPWEELCGRNAADQQRRRRQGGCQQWQRSQPQSVAKVRDECACK